MRDEPVEYSEVRPAMPTSPPEARPAPARKKPKAKWRSRLLIAALLMLAVATGALAVQGWRIVSAIVELEQAAVVPLPTRDADSPLAAARQTTATATSTPVPTTPTSTVASSPTPTERSARSSSSLAPPTDPTATPTEAPPPPTATSEPTPFSLPPTPTPNAAVEEDDGPSRLDVFREVAMAGIDGGDPGASEVWEGKTELNVLVVGVDRRPDGGDQNADVIILARVDLIGKQVAAVSIPRDLLVEIPGVGPDKINSSYNYGVLERPDDPAAGIAKVRDTVEYAFGIPIDHYVLVDFDGFEEVVDAMGGVDVNVPYEIYDPKYPTEDYGTEEVFFPAGEQRFDGDDALKYVRTRNADSDDQRRERQLQLLLALFDEGKSVGTISEADETILALGGSFQTSFELDEQLTLARLALATEHDDIRVSTLGQPTLQPGETETGAWVYVGDPAAIVAFIQEALITDPTLIGNVDSP